MAADILPKAITIKPASKDTNNEAADWEGESRRRVVVDARALPVGAATCAIIFDVGVAPAAAPAHTLPRDSSTPVHSVGSEKRILFLLVKILERMEIMKDVLR
ncbi:MAG: hypothetical protein Q9175_007139 [Cornicularia normoerica]